jgi:hypothetical protein
VLRVYVSRGKAPVVGGGMPGDIVVARYRFSPSVLSATATARK